MTIKFFMDQHVPWSITIGLRLRGVDVITAYEDVSSELDDSNLLDRASQMERALFTRDVDLLSEAARRKSEGVFFHGVIYSHQLKTSIGTCIHDLEIIARAGEPKDIIGDVIFLPI